MIGNFIAIAVIRKLAIFVYLPENFEGGIIIPRGEFSQAGNLLLPS
jgi:hypothetical protein